MAAHQFPSDAHRLYLVCQGSFWDRDPPVRRLLHFRALLTPRNVYFRLPNSEGEGAVPAEMG